MLGTKNVETCQPFDPQSPKSESFRGEFDVCLYWSCKLIHSTFGGINPQTRARLPWWNVCDNFLSSVHEAHHSSASHQCSRFGGYIGQVTSKINYFYLKKEQFLGTSIPFYSILETKSLHLIACFAAGWRSELLYKSSYLEHSLK